MKRAKDRVIKMVFISVLIFSVIVGFSALADAQRGGHGGGGHGGGGHGFGHNIGGHDNGGRSFGRQGNGGHNIGEQNIGRRSIDGRNIDRQSNFHSGFSRGRSGFRGHSRFGGPIIRGPVIRERLPRGALRWGFWGGVVVGGIYRPFYWPIYALPVWPGYYVPYGYPSYYQPSYVVVVPQPEYAEQPAATPENRCYGPTVDDTGEIIYDKDGNMMPDFTKPVPCPPQ